MLPAIVPVLNPEIHLCGDPERLSVTARFPLTIFKQNIHSSGRISIANDGSLQDLLIFRKSSNETFGIVWSSPHVSIVGLHHSKLASIGTSME